MSTRSRRHVPLDHVLIAGGLDDLDAMRALIALLPATAYGQVFLALDGDTDGASASEVAAQLRTPARVGVTTLTSSDAHAAAPGSALVTRGVVLAEAIASWVAEWIPDEPTIERVVSLWIGGRGSAAVDALCDETLCGQLAELQRL